MLNWEYEYTEQLLHSSSDMVQRDQSYKDNGEWRLIDSYACSAAYDFGENEILGYINVSEKK